MNHLNEPILDRNLLNEYSKRIKDLIEFMNFLLNDFLDLNKLDNKTFVLNKS